MAFLDKFYFHTWNIGFVEAEAKDIIARGEKELTVHWVKHSYKDRFFADPFILSVSLNEIKVLVEDFPYYTKRGEISMLTIDRKTYELKSKTVVLSQPFHMSYPFILRKDDGEILVAPEASQSGKLFYYTMNQNTGKLENQRILIDEPLLDSTILYYDGLWWLFCTKRGEHSNSDLFIYYADSLDGPWKSHMGNPHVHNKSFARPAGYFVKDESGLYRVIQKCDRCYGEAVHITRVNKLTEYDYSETFIRTLDLKKSEYSQRFHTLNSLNGISVVDGNISIFSPARRVYYEIMNKLGI